MSDLLINCILKASPRRSKKDKQLKQKQKIGEIIGIPLAVLSSTALVIGARIQNSKYHLGLHSIMMISQPQLLKGTERKEWMI